VTRVLVVDDDENLRHTVERDLRRQGFEVETAEDVEQALAVLTRASIDVLLTDLRMTGADGIDLLRSARLLSPRTRTLLMSGFGTARDYQAAVDLGAVRVLCKPFTSAELTLAVRQAVECAVGFRGSIHGLGLVDILQMFNLARRSVAVVIDVTPGAAPGVVHLRDGALVHAAVGDLVGEPALRALLAQAAGTLRTTTLTDDGPATIDRAFQEVVLDAIRALDEAPGTGDWDLEEWSEIDDDPTPAIDAVGLAERWHDAWRHVGEAADPVAVGVLLGSGDAVLLRGRGDAGAWSAPVKALTESVIQVDAASSYGLLDCCDPETGLFLIWDRRHGFAVVVADVVRGVGSMARLRTVVSTVARHLLQLEAT